MAAETPKIVWGFASDTDTVRIFSEALAENGMEVSRGSVTEAIRMLAQSPSPRLVVVDVDGSKFPVGKINELAEVCEFGTQVIAVGSNDSARLAREILEAGVADYIPKPVSARELSESAHIVLQDQNTRENSRAGRVVAFAGCGGGVGTTTLAAIVARRAAERGNWVSVLDLDRICGPLSLVLDVEPAAGLGEMLDQASGKEPKSELLDSVSTNCGPRISFFGYRHGGPKDWPVPTPTSLTWLADRLGNRSHLTLVDGLSDWETKQTILTDANQRVLVIEPNLHSVAHAVRLLESLGHHRSITLVQNQSRTHRKSLSDAQMTEALAGRKPDIVLPFEPGMPTATDHGWPEKTLGKKFREGLAKLLNELAASHQRSEEPE